MLSQVHRLEAIVRAVDTGEKPALRPNMHARLAPVLVEAGVIERPVRNGPYVMTERGRTLAERLSAIRERRDELASELDTLLGVRDDG